MSTVASGFLSNFFHVFNSQIDLKSTNEPQIIGLLPAKMLKMTVSIDKPTTVTTANI